MLTTISEFSILKGYIIKNFIDSINIIPSYTHLFSGNTLRRSLLNFMLYIVDTYQT